MKKVLFGLAIVLLCNSCDSYPETLFKEKASGHRAFGLVGTYAFTYKFSDSLVVCDTLRFQRLRKNDFLITDFSGKDTVFLGEIVKRKGLYFMNKPSREPGWWHITAFKFSGDSIYNYWALNGYQSYEQEVKRENLFSDVKETETAYYVNNSSVETYDAMESSVIRGDRAAYRELDAPEAATAEKVEVEKEPEISFLLYPNPVKERLIIETKGDGNYRAEMIDLNGKTVKTASFSEGYFTLDLSSVPNGNYIARITTLGDGTESNFKLVVQK